MVKLFVTIAEYAALVSRPISRIHSHWDRHFLQGTRQINAVRDDIVSWNFKRPTVLLAALPDCHIWILISEKYPSISNIFERIVYKTSVASLIPVASRAINQLLFWQRLQFSIANFTQPFESPCCWKCPMRYAWTLIFNRSDSTSGNPVNLRANKVILSINNLIFLRGDGT